MSKHTWYKTYRPYISPLDPCPPITVKRYSTPPELYVGYQPPGLAQFPAYEALKAGTLWKCFYDPYYSVKEMKKGVRE
ncbi:spore coat associated protein CotJA [Pseudobacillus badius]|uniref:spore coat associated protein CotJA n=1 Tax=Bacillus badius TaxID=1455 RepID=UPI0007B0A693|nr:spore coat associated protein CotJA [Bacillus badius]KZN98948.1 spore coat protein CotJA [Bacillus badius]MED0664879.1 spore coat associated protein CotJA [Bacillus badius]OCS83884.1 spore coat protein CotJA [Bacillus badius]OVE52823.1 spore coat protein CotJA [Bacillus badius]TDW04848.1 spore coat protein JA [Bacillus badius]